MNVCEYADIGGPQPETNELILEAALDSPRIAVLQMPDCVDGFQE
jgi:hypothetical protein